MVTGSVSGARMLALRALAPTSVYYVVGMRTHGQSERCHQGKRNISSFPRSLPHLGLVDDAEEAAGLLLRARPRVGHQLQVLGRLPVDEQATPLSVPECDLEAPEFV